ncbi:YndM family protein [Heyndrickxia acidiproducens]|uniref:YndM family protein n=1 Tax=Heyndrickxia acidiproducens TaxID=1121084 RepID=UPI00037B79BE|nr:YndM family protein [Heyndrickxia acidiproducens]
MRYATALIMKLVVAIIAFAIALDLFFDANITDILSFSLLVTVVSFIIGDLLLLPRIGNWKATVVDFLLVYAAVWIFGSVVLNHYLQIAWGSIIAAIIISASEVFVHRYLLKSDTEKSGRPAQSKRQQLAYSTEFAKDEDATNIKPKKDEE